MIDRSDTNVTESADTASETAGFFIYLAQAIRRHWSVVAWVFALFLLLGFLQFLTAPRVYTVVFKVTPVTSAQQIPTGGLAGLANLAGIGLSGHSQTMDFDLYQEGLRSHAAAEALARQPVVMHALFADQWDAEHRVWVKHEGLLTPIKNTIEYILGMYVEPWHAPDAGSVWKRLNEDVAVNSTPDSPIVTVTLKASDPALGKMLISALNKAVDDQLRRKTLQRATKYSDYLTNLLSHTTVGDYREALMGTLVDQERLKMAASADLPFAADPTGSPVASDYPVSPNFAATMFTWAFVGILAGIGLAWLLDILGLTAGMLPRRFREHLTGARHLRHSA